eukprot:789046-Prorocentrum_minimum.AAC.1
MATRQTPETRQHRDTERPQRQRDTETADGRHSDTERPQRHGDTETADGRRRAGIITGIGAEARGLEVRQRGERGERGDTERGKAAARGPEEAECGEDTLQRRRAQRMERSGGEDPGGGDPEVRRRGDGERGYGAERERAAAPGPEAQWRGEEGRRGGAERAKATAKATVKATAKVTGPETQRGSHRTERNGIAPVETRRPASRCTGAPQPPPGGSAGRGGEGGSADAASFAASSAQVSRRDSGVGGGVRGPSPSGQTFRPSHHPSGEEASPPFGHTEYPFNHVLSPSGRDSGPSEGFFAPSVRDAAAKSGGDGGLGGGRWDAALVSLRKRAERTAAQGSASSFSTGCQEGDVADI